MILNKSNKVVYLFDFDGTLVGEHKFNSLLKFHLGAYNRLHFNPNDYDIRWSILTARPKMDIPWIKICCKKHGFTPKNIITSETFRYKFKNLTEVCNYKERVIKEILDKKRKLNEVHENVSMVYYIDNDISILKQIDSNRNKYDYKTITVKEFISGEYFQTLL